MNAETVGDGNNDFIRAHPPVNLNLTGTNN